MARARSQAAKNASADTPTELVCPECGQTFTRPASLGAHRNRAHGVAGASAQSATRRKRGTGSRAGAGGAARSTGNGAAKTKRAASTGATASRTRAASGSRAGSRAGGSRGQSRSGSASVNRDSLLQALFPGGIPARESVIREVNSWLDEAERLAKLA
jgi:uncharacterized C2H2 Zn-finger protein